MLRATETGPLASDEPDLLCPRAARAQLAELLTRQPQPRRAVIVGTAGSGKSRVLRALRRSLEAAGAATAWAEPGSTPAADADAVLLVDDLDLLPDAALDEVIRRSEDPAASVIATVRTGPLSSEVDRLVHVLERSAPAIVLGHLSAADLADGAPRGHRIDPACADAIVTTTGGIAWLVWTAVSLHDDGCRGAAAHADLHDALIELVAHRVDMLDPAVREAVETACSTDTDTGTAAGDPDLTARAHGAGLVLRSGHAPPLVRSAVRTMISPPGPPAPAAAGAADTDARAALGAGFAAYARGALDEAARLAESAGDADDTRDDLTDLAAAVWAARGMPEQAAQVYRARTPQRPASRARAAVAALAIGDADALRAWTTPDDAAPTTRTVASSLLVSGLRATLGDDPESALPDLVRAADLAAADEDAAPDQPAVVAAVAAVAAGDLDTAQTVVDSAVAAGQGGEAAADRLRLWSSWIALQRERPHEAAASLRIAEESPRPLDPRDAVLAAAIRVATARRYADAAALDAAWHSAKGSLLRARFDLFSLLPLTEFVVASARLRDTARVDGRLGEAFALVAALGNPIGWSAHLHWAATQRAILRSRPAELAPHARALVAAAPTSPVAATMAQAGRVWTSVLSGSVDPDAVEAAAHALAAIGLAWDGARLAGHGANRSEDRKVIARLLATARQLHPREEHPAPPESAHPDAPATPAALLTPREREVAELVVQGKTYVEIGEAIFISPRTAEHHIARIRRRLSATSRSDLISRLRGLLEESDAPGPDADARPPHAAENPHAPEMSTTEVI